MSARPNKTAAESSAPAKPLQRRPSHLPPPVYPRRAFERDLVEIWQAELGIGPIGIDDDYFELDGNSVSAINIFLAFEKKCAVNFDPSLLVEYPTIRVLAAHARADTSLDDSDGIVAFRDSGLTVPVYFVPGVRGEALTARSLARALGDGIPFYGVQNTDVGAVAEPSVEAIAGHLASIIRRANADGPCVLAGYCAGAILAYETARQLRGAGVDVPLLVMLDAINKAAFGLTDRWAAKWRGFRRLDAADAGRKLRQFARDTIRSVLIRTPAIGAVVERRNEETAGVDLLQGPVEQAIRAAYVRYRPGPYDGPIALYTSEEYRTRLADNEFGWTKLATAGLDVIDLPTDHFGMLKPESIKIIGDDMRARITALGSFD